jgi:hypothetical protein
MLGDKMLALGVQLQLSVRHSSPAFVWMNLGFTKTIVPKVSSPAMD